MGKYVKVLICILFLWVTASTAQAQEKVDLKTRIRYQLDSIDGVYIPRDINDAFEQIDTFWSDSLKQEVKQMPEQDFAVAAHMGFGMWMRNNWKLWGGSRLSKYFNDLGVFHPDDISGIILDSYHRYLSGKEIGLDEQIAYYKQYWEQQKSSSLISEPSPQYLKSVRKEMRPYKPGKILQYDYPYGFSSLAEENSHDSGECIALGEIIEVDLNSRLVKIKLVACCNPAGVITYDTHYETTSYKDETYDSDGKIIPQEGRKIFYMQQGDEQWFSPDNEYWQY